MGSSPRSWSISRTRQAQRSFHTCSHGLEPRALLRRKEPEYAELGLDDPSLSRDALIAVMVAHPRLIERPIVVKDGRAALGRPPAAVLEIL